MPGLVALHCLQSPDFPSWADCVVIEPIGRLGVFWATRVMFVDIIFFFSFHVPITALVFEYHREIMR